MVSARIASRFRIDVVAVLGEDEMRIAFTGHKESGKSECAKAARFHLDGGVTIDMMRLLRTGLMELIGKLGVKVPTSHFYGEKTPESRRLLQAAGNYARSLDRDILVRYACQFIDRMSPEMHVFIENMRMQYEEKVFRQRGFIVVRVVRPGYNGDDDETETEIPFIREDALIMNDKGISDLKVVVAKLLDDMRGQ